MLKHLIRMACIRNGNRINRLTVMLLTVSLLFGSGLLGGTTAHAETVSIVMFEYPPFMSASLPNNGLLGEIITEAFRLVGYDVSYKYYPLKRATQYVLEGKSLATVGGPFQFPEGTHHAIQSTSISYIRVPAFYLKERFQTLSLPTLKDLRGYSIGSLLGGGDVSVLRQDPEINVEEVPSIEQLFKKVETGRNDFGTLVDLSILSFLAANKPNWQERWGISDDIIVGTPIGLNFSKNFSGYEAYQNAFSEGFQQMRDNGSYRRIMETYYGSELAGKASDSAKPPYVIPIE